jgi:hypothetical protein
MKSKELCNNGDKHQGKAVTNYIHFAVSVTEILRYTYNISNKMLSQHTNIKIT